jgi:hypothetical protein
VNIVVKMENIGYSTIDEIINDILQVLSPEYQETIKEMSNEDYREIEHFNFGQWIKNKYFNQNPAKEMLVKSLSDPKAYIVLDDEKFSHMILEKLYEKIAIGKMK